MPRQYGYRAPSEPASRRLSRGVRRVPNLAADNAARTAPSHNILKNCGKIALENTPQSLLRSFYARSFRAAV